MNRSLLLWAFLVAFWDVNAQVPGYLGKRFTVEGNLVAGLALNQLSRRHLDFNKYIKDLDALSFPIAPAVAFNTQIGYVVRRRAQINVSIGYSQKPTLISGNHKFDLSQFYSEPINALYNVHAISYGINYKIFTKRFGGLAPVGLYWSFGLTNTTYIGNAKWYKLLTNDLYASVDNKNSTNLPKNLKISFLHLPIEFGKNTLYKDKLLINYGMRFAFPMFFITDKFEEEQAIEDPDLKSLTQSYNNQVESDHEFRTLLTIYLGIGYIF